MDHAISVTLAGPGIAPTGTVTKTGSGELRFDDTISIAANVAVSLAWANASLKSLFMLSDQDVLIESNSSSSPDSTLNLKANVPFYWQVDGYFANPFVAANVASLFITNASAAAARVQIYGLIDGTP